MPRSCKPQCRLRSSCRTPLCWHNTCVCTLLCASVVLDLARYLSAQQTCAREILCTAASPAVRCLVRRYARRPKHCLSVDRAQVQEYLQYVEARCAHCRSFLLVVTAKLMFIIGEPVPRMTLITLCLFCRSETRNAATMTDARPCELPAPASASAACLMRKVWFKACPLCHHFDWQKAVLLAACA